MICVCANEHCSLKMNIEVFWCGDNADASGFWVFWVHLQRPCFLGVLIMDCAETGGQSRVTMCYSVKIELVDMESMS
jgi:hypothetical protein